MQHVEFFDREHFEYNFHRKKAAAPLDTYIDFFWQTRFDHLFASRPAFTDVLFPNVGYTYMINLGSPFTIRLNNDEPYVVKSGAFIPRFANISTHHTPGNEIFGIKFTISPNLLEKEINFSEYRTRPSSLAYLIHTDTVAAVKSASDFTERTNIVTSYYKRLIRQHEQTARSVLIVKRALERVPKQNEWRTTVASLAGDFGIDVRTLQRYFEAVTGISTKQAIQIMKIRKAISTLIQSPGTFDPTAFGYYDYSHFYKQMHAFFNQHPAFDRTNYLPRSHESPVKINY